MAICKARSRPLPRNGSVGTLTLKLPAARRVRNMRLLFISHPACRYSSPNGLGHLPQGLSAQGKRRKVTEEGLERSGDQQSQVGSQVSKACRADQAPTGLASHAGSPGLCSETASLAPITESPVGMQVTMWPCDINEALGRKTNLVLHPSSIIY